jgi:hypothetical protein
MKTVRKAKEYADFALFKDLFQKEVGEEFPAGCVLQGEKPDFVVHQPQAPLGIEITELHREKGGTDRYTPAQKTGFSQKIVDDARQLCERWGVPPLWVTVWIIGGLGHVQGRRDRKTLSEKLASLVQQWSNANPQDSRAWLKPWDVLPEIFQIGIFRRQGYEHLWEWNAGAVAVGPVSIDALQKRIGEKDNEFEEYRRRCNECWLVIVGDPCEPSMGADIGLDPAARTYKYRSKFDRIFFLQRLDNLVELELADP